MYYDIYGFSRQRDKKVIEIFLGHFTNRSRIEDCKGSEISIIGNKKYKIQEEWILINTLTEVIEYGIKNKNKGFAFYIGPNHLKGVKWIILKFTYDGYLILGLSIEAEKADGKDNYSKAKRLEKQLRSLFFIQKTSIQLESPPADDKEEFEANNTLWSVNG